VVVLEKADSAPSPRLGQPVRDVASGEAGADDRYIQIFHIGILFP
jgi:hypothetical protein